MFSFQFVVLPMDQGDFLDWSARKAQVLMEVLKWRPQILCLQELDAVHWPALQGELSQWGGYAASSFVARRGRNGTEVQDGICTLYNPQVWRLMDSKALLLQNEDK